MFMSNRGLKNLPKQYILWRRFGYKHLINVGGSAMSQSLAVAGIEKKDI